MIDLIWICVAFIVGMALGGLVVGMDKDSAHKEGENGTKDNTV